MSFGDRLKKLRKEKKWSQEELAKKVNMTKSNISKYERSLLEPNNETLKKFADLFGVTVDYLLGRSNIRNPYEEYKEKEITATVIKEDDCECYDDLLDEKVSIRELIELVKKRKEKKENIK